SRLPRKLLRLPLGRIPPSPGENSMRRLAGLTLPLALGLLALAVRPTSSLAAGKRSRVAEPPTPSVDAAAAPQTARPAKNCKLLPGFEAELIYAVPKQNQGSWVNLTVDPQGRLITSDQYGALYRITPPPLGDRQTPTKVELLDVKIGQAQGLLCAFG